MVTTLNEKIIKKQQKIAKLKKSLLKLLSECSKEEYEAIVYYIETGDRSLYKTYLKNHNLSYGGDAWSKANEYYDSLNTLDKYQKQLKAEEDKQNTLSELPEVIINFRDNLITRWDEFDTYKRDTIKAEYKQLSNLNYRERYRTLSEKWGRGYYEFMGLSDSDIHKSNVKDAENLILNMVNRVIEKTGKITNASGLYIDRDNSGYTIINGIIIGENGCCRIESIGAGGYNIQRYHIRVLVK